MSNTASEPQLCDVCRTRVLPGIGCACVSSAIRMEAVLGMLNELKCQAVANSNFTVGSQLRDAAKSLVCAMHCDRHPNYTGLD